MSKEELPRWDLNRLYTGPSDTDLERELQEAKAAVNAFRDRYRGWFERGDDAETLARALAEYEALQKKIAEKHGYEIQDHSLVIYVRPKKKG